MNEQYFEWYFIKELIKCEVLLQDSKIALVSLNGCDAGITGSYQGRFPGIFLKAFLVGQ